MDFMHIWGQKEAIWDTFFSILDLLRGVPENFRLSPPPNGPGSLKLFLLLLQLEMYEA